MTERSRLYLGDLRDESAGIVVAPFRLERCLGTGSMGEVWLATHIEQDVKVALKVIVSDRAMHRQFHRAFRQEVRSMARLNHPFVIDVYDYGEIDERAEDFSLGQIRAGSPFVAMEYAEAGTLADKLQGPVSWSIVQLILFALLDALAHSHARGVVHRDIKPQNVLLALHGRDLGIRISDYGLAYALRDTQEVANWHRAAGTPEYMAPELVTGNWRRYGPATDLYALGCMAYQLLEGVPPFEGDNVVQIAKAQLDSSPPALSSNVDCPPELNRWLQVMLAKDVGNRFRNAAAAARALRQISGPLDESKLRREWMEFLSMSDRPAAVEGGDNGRQSIFPIHSLDVVIYSEDESESRRPPQWNGGHDAPRLLEIPDTWRRRKIFTPSLRMVGTGRGLFRLRRLPLLGRQGERDHLWERFHRTVDDGQIRATLLRGPAGVGKDYLAEWFCDRSGELGVAQVFRAFHESSEEVVDGVAEMIRRYFSLTGLNRHEVEAFFKSLLTDLGATDAYEWKAMTQLLVGGDGAAGEVRFSSPKQRYMAGARFLERLAQRGPVVLWLNDVQWGLEVLHFVQVLLDQPGIEAPIYIVMTARSDLLASASPLHRDKMELILESDRADCIEIDPLDETTIRQLVEEALFLDASASYEVARRSGGNPLHALELVGAWLDRDLLQATRRGYVLREDVEPGESGEWMDVWAEVVERLAKGSEDRRTTLEIGAILGERIQRSVWSEAVQRVGAEFREEVVGELLERMYLYESPQGLVFTQNMLREALLDSAKCDGRWQACCLAVARALDEQSQATRYDERAGLLLLEAGESIEGAQWLLRAVEKHYQNREYHAMIHLAERGQKALRHVESRQGRRLRAKLMVKLSHGWHGVGIQDVALKVAKASQEIADSIEDAGLQGESRLHQIAPLNIIGEFAQARMVGREALGFLEGRAGHESDYALVLLALVHLEMRQGQFDVAFDYLGEATRLLQGIQAPVVQCQAAFVELKARMINREQVDRSEAEQVIEACRQANTTLGEVQTLNIRAEIARRNGALDEARIWYEKAFELARLIDPDRAVIPRMNLVLLDVHRGQLINAGLAAQRILLDLRRKQRPQLELWAKTAVLPMHIVRADYDEAQSIVDDIQELAKRLGVGADPDLELCLRAAWEAVPKENGQQLLRDRLQKLLALVGETKLT